MRALPFLLVTIRSLLGPGLVLLALEHRRGLWLVIPIAAALISDIYDGRIARHYGVATAGLRRYDSIADTIFYVCVAMSAWILEREALIAVAKLLVAIATLEAFRYTLDFVKFRREASYHMWSAKLWGLFLAASASALLGWGIAGLLLRTALIIGIISDLAGVAISVVLPRWTHDVATIFHAIKLRKDLTRDQSALISE
jgi:phosphatidylglycerophosphate synthase